jgi:hypothetical protein
MKHAWALALVWLPLAGCVNHARFLDVQREINSSEAVSAAYRIEGARPVLREPSLELSVARVETYRDLRTRTTVMFEEYTPYRGVRELYEVPLGLLATGPSVVANLIGLEGQADRAWAAANPFMNVEDRHRLERRELHTIDSRTDVEERRVRTPLAGGAVEVRFDDAQPVVFRADEHGLVSFHLLDLVTPRLSLRPRKLFVTLEQVEGEPIVREFLLRRDLAHSVGQARQHVLTLQRGSATVESLADAIYGLDQLGFEAYSLEAEEAITARYRADTLFLVEFEDTLDGLYGRRSGAGEPEAMSARKAAEAPESRAD